MASFMADPQSVYLQRRDGIVQEQTNRLWQNRGKNYHLVSH